MPQVEDTPFPAICCNASNVVLKVVGSNQQTVINFKTTFYDRKSTSYTLLESEMKSCQNIAIQPQLVEKPRVRLCRSFWNNVKSFSTSSNKVAVQKQEGCSPAIFLKNYHVLNLPSVTGRSRCIGLYGPLVGEYKSGQVEHVFHHRPFDLDVES